MQGAGNTLLFTGRAGNVDQVHHQFHQALPVDVVDGPGQ